MKQQEAPVTKDRLMSIDALRGFDMFWIAGGGAVVTGFLKGAMSPVPEGILYQFEHPAWLGFSAWDMIMPLFLFIVGTSMPFAFGKRLEGADKARVYRHIIRRVILLFILGMVAQGNLLKYDMSKLHLYSNTLQAIASGYLVASVLMLNFSIAVQAGAGMACLVAYWVLLKFVPFGDVAAGSLEPLQNFAMAVDVAILGPFRDGTTYTWLVSGLGFAATTLMGVMAGHILKSDKPANTKTIWLAGAGVGCLAAGWVWSFHLPIIKHIWTSSMALWAGGWSYLLLALFYYVIDVKKYRKWAFFFIVIGTNAIAVYMATEIFDFRHVGDVFVGGLVERAGMWGEFLRATAAFAVVWMILLFMHRKKIFIKV